MKKANNKNQYEENSQIFVLCLNPRCQRPSHRCLDGCSIRTHPNQCSRYYYPADTIMEKHWSEIEDYPADAIGISVGKKIDTKTTQSFFQRVIGSFKLKVMKIIQDFTQAFKEVYPISYLEERFQSVYGLQKVANSLKDKDSPEYISRMISQNMSEGKFNELMVINEKLDRMGQTFQSICDGVQKHLNQIVALTSESQSMKKAMPQNFDKKINYGVVRSKYIASSKISVQKGVITFPKLTQVASFLPWLYTDRSFKTGPHTMRITSLRFPLVPNSGLLVLEEHDIDTYPYTFFKSLFSKQGKGFVLTSGTQIEHFISQTTSVVLRLQVSPKPMAIIHDAQLRCRYECELPEDRSYRLGIYGSGWSLSIIQLV